VHQQQRRAGEVADVEVGAGALHGVTTEAHELPSFIDELPALAAAAALCDGPSCFRGLARIRDKESDRLRASVELLQAFGVEASAEGDDLCITGRPRRFTARPQVRSHGDHRIAMAALALARASDVDVVVDDTACIDKSFPGFVGVLSRLR
jgi:3-phosphoshikimate 1-carboxyvinyltransferase